MGQLGAGLRDQLGRLSLPSLPTLGRKVELPVYLIHNSIDPEDYFFIFDFEDFVEHARSGVFVRPSIRIWAGRDDFERRQFARHMRTSFAAEFEAARAQLAAQDGKSQGWFGFLKSSLGDVGSLSGFVSNVVLLVALSAGKLAFKQILPAGWLEGKSDKQRLEQGIEETKAKVDEALADVNITLHIELYRHAYRGHQPGRLSGMDYEAWPLPANVAAHLNDGISTSWW